ncbi:MAG: serine/threonine protein kinase [Bacteroidetes bacterium]|nr:MAG: serine/threonine protein kinase [Bacteroidota bacterium]
MRTFINKNMGTKFFLVKWIGVTSISWMVGLILSFVVAYLVNSIYPKETNLVLGLCVGASVGYSQWGFLLRKQMKITGWWGMASTFGLGIPFILVVIGNEVGVDLPDLPGGDMTDRLIIGLLGGLLGGLLQYPLLKHQFRRTYLWILASSIAWGSCWMTTAIPGISGFIGVIMGGIFLSVITGACLIYLPKR